MSSTAEITRREMRGHVGLIVGLAGASRKVAFAQVARVLGLSLSRVKCLYYGEARRIEAWEADRVRAYVESAQKLIEARADYERLRGEFVAANPSLVRFAPGPLAHDDVSGEAQSIARQKVKR